MGDLTDLAREAGALQLGEDGLKSGPQFIFSVEQLARFAALLAVPELPPLPY